MGRPVEDGLMSAPDRPPVLPCFRWKRKGFAKHLVRQFKPLLMQIRARLPGVTAELFSYSWWFIQKVIPGSKSNEMEQGKQGGVKNCWSVHEWKGCHWGQLGFNPSGVLVGNCVDCASHRLGGREGAIYPQLLSLISCELLITDSLAFLGGFLCRLSKLQGRLRKPPGQRIWESPALRLGCISSLEIVLRSCRWTQRWAKRIWGTFATVQNIERTSILKRDEPLNYITIW